MAVSERYYGRFERRLALGREADEDNVSAAFKNGVLTVTLPKSEKAQAKAKRIAINSSKCQLTRRVPPVRRTRHFPLQTEALHKNRIKPESLASRSEVRTASDGCWSHRRSVDGYGCRGDIQTRPFLPD